MESVNSVYFALFIIGGIAGVLILLCALMAEVDDNDKLGIFCICSLVVVVVCFILGFFAIPIIKPDIRREWVKTEIELVSMRDRDLVSGRFFMGSGYVEGSPYYFYYEKLENNAYRPGKVRADGSVIIYEQERENGRLEIYEYKIIPEHEWWEPYGNIYPLSRCKFCIPKGSIQKRFFLE